MPHGQEKLKKNDKSQVKMGVFKKSQIFFFKHQILSVQIYKLPNIYKPSIGKKKIKSSLKTNIAKFS